MKLKLKLITSAVAFYSLLAYPLFVCGQQKTCTIKGTIINRNSDTLMLLKATDNMRAHQLIPIVNNSFTYTLTFTETEAWVLVFQDEYRNGAYKKIDFFTDTSAVSFKLYPLSESDEKNEIKGGKLTRELYARRARMESLFGAKGRELNLRVRALVESKNYHNRLYEDVVRQVTAAPTQDLKRPLYDKMNEMEKSGDNLTPDGQKVKRSIDSLTVLKNSRKYEEIIAAPSLAGYYEVWRDVVYFNKEIPQINEMIKQAYPLLAKTFAEHSYTRLVGNELNGELKVKPGEQFIDFSAPDIDGKKYTLSAEIKGKVTLIDFWGSWCGPCIAATKTMLPVYREFKDKGFNVVGIAREFKSLNGLNIALKRENYPWLNLVDLDDKNGIWNKYAISANAGMILLVDASGKILAVDPTAEQVRKILLKVL